MFISNISLTVRLFKEPGHQVGHPAARQRHQGRQQEGREGGL